MKKKITYSTVIVGLILLLVAFQLEKDSGDITPMDRQEPKELRSPQERESLLKNKFDAFGLDIITRMLKEQSEKLFSLYRSSGYR